MIRRIAATVWLGLGLIAASEILLSLDLQAERRGAIETQSEMLRLGENPPANFAESIARWVSINMTPLAWLGYVLFLDGVTTTQTGRGPVRGRPHHFAFCALASILIWCVFDAINFYCFSPPAWTYIGLPLNWPQRFIGYAVAFAAELPGMFLTAQVILNLGWVDGLRGKPLRLPRSADAFVSLIGLALLLWAILGRNSVANYGLWCSFVLLLDPINRRLGRPSMFGDWENGWYGRSVALFSGGLICGFLWEFWNYWALAKWIYHLPFLGSTEHIRYFQMPVIGLLGFIPFAMACWAMWQTVRIPLDGLVEPLPNDATII
jgi:hypothetical protein